MTIIAVQKTTTGILMGADNRTSDGARLLMRATPKIYQISPHVVMGSSGHVRIADIVRRKSITFPTRVCGNQLEYPYANQDYSQVIGEWFRDVLKDEPKDARYWAIVAAHNEIYDIGPGGSVVPIAGNYHTSGSGELVALGALYAWNRAWRDQEWNEMPVPLLPDVVTAKEGLTMALDACAAHVEAITPPWSFLESVA